MSANGAAVLAVAGPRVGLPRSVGRCSAPTHSRDLALALPALGHSYLQVSQSPLASHCASHPVLGQRFLHEGAYMGQRLGTGYFWIWEPYYQNHSLQMITKAAVWLLRAPT